MIKVDRRKDELTLVSENPPANRWLVIGAQLAGIGAVIAGGFRFTENPSLQVWFWAVIAVLVLWVAFWLARFKQVVKTTTTFDLRKRRVKSTSLLLHLVTQRQHTEEPVDAAFDEIEELRLSAKRGTMSLTLVMRDGPKRNLGEERQQPRSTPSWDEFRAAAKLIEQQTGLGLNDTITPPRAVVLT